MRIQSVRLFALLFLATGTGLWAQAPGTTPEDESPTGTAGALKSQITTGGSYDAYSGNATRIVPDLDVPDALGSYGLDFVRYWNSNHNDYDDPNAEWPLDFGASGWSHSWHWHAEEVAYSESLGDGEEELFHTAIIITFPDGHTTKFKIVRSNRPHGLPGNIAPPDPRLGPPYTDPEINYGWPEGGMGVNDHLDRMAVNGGEFWLSRADGGSVHFVGSKATEVFDPNGFKTTLRYNAYGDLYQVEQEGGRLLNISWSVFEGGWRVITKVETGGTAGFQRVSYKYERVDNFLVLAAVLYTDDQAPGQNAWARYTYSTCNGDDVTGPCDPIPSVAPMLKRADDPRYAGAMTKIRYTYAGGGCAPPVITPWIYPNFVPAQPYALATEKSDEGVLVSQFSIECTSGVREENDGLGGRRRFYFGTAAQTFEPAPPPDGPFGCRGFQLGKVTEFTRVPYIGAGLPCPPGVACNRQNYSFGSPRHRWDGRNIMTEEKVTPGDESGRPSRINHISDGSNATYERITPANATPLDTSRMHNYRHHWLFSKKDENNNVTTYTRDERRRITQINYPDGSSESYTYNQLNQVETHTLPSHSLQQPAVVYFHYNGLQQLDWEHNSVEGWEARKEYVYDSLGRVAQMTDGRARINSAPFTVKMTYNGRHKVLSVEYPPTGGDPHPTMRYEYDKYGNCTAIEDELHHRKEFTYDSYRRCTSQTEFLNAPGCNVTSRKWNWYYDRYFDDLGLISAAAHTSSKWRVQVEPIFNSSGHRRLTAHKFDHNDQMIEEVTGMFEAADGTWHAEGDTEVHTFAYDENGQKKTFQDPLGRVTDYTYDSRNRLKEVIEPKRTDQTARPTTTTEYDFAGNKTKVTFPDGRTQQWLNFDAFGQARQFIDERGNPTDFNYWQWGPMKKLAQVITHRQKDNSTEIEHQLTEFFPTKIGQPWLTRFPDGSTEMSTFRFGQLEAFKTRKNQTKTIVYDARGREQSQSFNDGVTPSISRVWDDANRLTSIANVFSTISYSYDDAGQMRTEGTSVIGAGAQNQVNEVSYCRYPSGEISQLTYPNGTVVNRNYTARGQLAGVGWGTGSTSYAYLRDGKVDYQARTNGVTTSYGYDGRGMISSVKHRNDAAGHDLAYREYWRDDRDRILAWKRGTDNHFNAMEDGRGNRYAYDAEGQLVRAWYRAQNPEAANPVDPKRGDQLQYDALGNRVEWNTVASRGPMLFKRKNNGLNQYFGWENSYPNPPEHWGTTTNYDDDVGGSWGAPGAANGVLMQDGWITAGYNALNQPVSIGGLGYSGSGNWMWFGYDPLGRCVKRWTSAFGNPNTTAATFFYYDGWNLVQEGPSAALADRVYVHGSRVDEIVASQVGGNWYHHHYDAQGNCILQSTASGGIQVQYDYDAFGFPYFYNAAGGKGASQTRFLFTGREYLPILRIYDYRNRLYQPELGRFMQPDPQEFDAGDYNLYRYCHNDPINHSDPTGLETLTRPEIDEQVGNRISEIGQFVGDHKHGVLDALGTIDPTPITDSFNAGLYAQEGDLSNATVSGLGAAFPYVGDVAKIGKYGAMAVAATGRLSGPAFKTAKEAAVAAKANGWKVVSGMRSMGQKIYTDGKRFFARDITGHKGGAWKELNKKGERIQTVDEKLKKVGK